jgi:putative flippase GtrA
MLAKRYPGQHLAIIDRDTFGAVKLRLNVSAGRLHLTYEIVHLLNPLKPQATTSWVIAFGIGIVRQHHLHRTLSFPKNGVPYGLSLWKDFLASLGIVAASAAVNFALTEISGMHHRTAWAICLASVAVFDYLIMKFFVFSRTKSSEHEP